MVGRVGQVLFWSQSALLVVALALFAQSAYADDIAKNADATGSVGSVESKEGSASRNQVDQGANSKSDTSESSHTTNVSEDDSKKTSDSQTGADKSSEAADKPSTSGTTLKGGVRGTALLTVDGLVGLEADAKMLQTSVYEIMRECTRKETAVMRGPNYVGNGIVIPAIGGPSGMVQVGDLPARRDKLESWLGSSEEVCNVLQNHMDALILPENPPEQMANLWSGMRSTLQAARGNIDQMKELLAQKKFDKKQVGRAALKVYDSMTALDKMRAQILSMVQAKE